LRILSTQVFVTVSDLNDNSPVFTSNVYHASVIENSSKNSDIITVLATDLDQEQFGMVKYR